MSEYDIYGPDGADEWERKQMGLTIEEYEQYLKDGYIKEIKMIDLVFDEFLKSNIEFEEGSDILTDEYKIYYEDFFSENISDDIINDIIEFRDKLVKDKFRDKFGLTFDECLLNPDIDQKEVEYICLNTQKSILKYSLMEHNIKEEDLIETLVSEVSIEDIVENSNIKLVDGELYDNYGSGLYEVGNRKFVIFSNYDCGSFVENSIASLCCYDPITFKFELADIICDLKNRSFYLSEIQTGYMPEQYRKYHIKEFVGKRSFRWHPEENYLLLRTSLEVLEQEPDIDKKLRIELT